MDKHVQHTFDAVVIGGGPGGMVTAAILADAGFKVAVLEKESFPRYRIGESMIPYNYFPLERIGMIDRMKASDFPKKYSVQFVGRSGKQSQPFYFSSHLNHPCAQTWQVTRDKFDSMMMDNAREHGVVVFENMRADSLIEEEDATKGVVAADSDGATHAFNAKMTIDASGQGHFAMKQLGWRIIDENLIKYCVWGYYRGAQRDPGKDEGATTITYLENKNWFWYIPLRDDIVSVGVVGDKDYLMSETNELATIFNREVKKNAWIEQHLQSAALEGDYRVCVHKSYRSKYCAKEGLVLIGDALSFLDPVFSTGMYLTLASGESAADAIIAGLKDGDVSGQRFVEYGETMCHRIEVLRQLVYAYYAEDFSFKQLIMKYPHLKGSVTDILVGNVDHDFSELTEALSEFLEIPPAIAHGRAKC